MRVSVMLLVGLAGVVLLSGVHASPLARLQQQQQVGDTCFARCAVEGVACVAQCPSYSSGMVGSPAVSCKAACDIKAAACAAECALYEKAPKVLHSVVAAVMEEEAAAPAQVGKNTACFAKCAAEGVACIAQCPSLTAGMVGSPDLSCHADCDVKAAACAAVCALATDAPAVSPIADKVAMSPSALCAMRRAFVGAAQLDDGKTCPPEQPTCEYLPGKVECCLAGEGCIKNVGCRC